MKALSVRCLFSLSLAILLLASGCGRRETAVQRGNREQILHRGISPDIAELDPQLSTFGNDYAALTALFEGLVAEDPVDLHPVPGVAERWDITPDGLRYTFHLRANAKWSNGEPVTAADFVSSFKRILTPSLGAEYAPLLYVIDQAEAYHKGSVTDFARVGVSALDARTLQIKLDHPAPAFLTMLTLAPFMPVPIRTIEQHGAVADRRNTWARQGTLVCNGPFNLKEWRAGQKMVLVKSQTYWDSATVRLNEIHLYATESRDAEERSFRAGQLHITEAVPPTKVDAWRMSDPARLRVDPYLGTEFYRINVTRPFLNDKRVRRALALAVDRQALVATILRGGQSAASAFTPPNTAGYTSSAAIPTDLDAARSLLAEAGYPGGKGAPPVEIVFNTSESHRAVAEAVQEAWRRELGLDVRLLNQELTSLRAARRTGDFQILRSAWIADFVDPLSFLSVWTADSGNNYTGWRNPLFDQLLFEAARQPDAAAARTLYQKAESILLDEAPLIPLYHYTHVFLIQPSVKGWHPTLLDHHPYKQVYLQSGE